MESVRQQQQPRFSLGGVVDHLRQEWHEAKTGDRLCVIQLIANSGFRWRVVTPSGSFVLCDRLSYRSVISLVYALDTSCVAQSMNRFTSNGGLSNISSETLLDENALRQVEPFFIAK